MKSTNKPAIRFKGYNDAWEQRKWSNTVDISTDMVDPKTGLYDELPHVAPGNIESFTGRLFDNVKLVKDENLISGKFRFSAGDIIYGKINPQLGKYVFAAFSGLTSADAYVLNAKNGIDQKFLYAVLQTKDFFDYSVSVSKRSGMPKINRDELNAYSFAAPSTAEQAKIGSFLLSIDNLITLHQRKLEKLKNIKNSMLEKMFPKNYKDVPEIRFSGFTEAWEQRKLGDMMNVTSVKRIHQSDWTNSGIRFLRARDIVAAAKGEEPSDLLYISKEKYEEYSSLSGKVAIDDLLVTGVGTIGIPYLISNSEPLYFKDGNIIWFQNCGKINGKFFYYSFTGEQIQSFVKDSAGIGTVGTYTIESGKKTPILLPCIEEQRKLGSFFTDLDNLITLHQRKLEKLQNIKKSCLEKMFV